MEPHRSIEEPDERASDQLAINTARRHPYAHLEEVHSAEVIARLPRGRVVVHLVELAVRETEKGHRPGHWHRRLVIVNVFDGTDARRIIHLNTRDLGCLIEAGERVLANAEAARALAAGGSR